ncbi:hypothetical protein ACOZ4N_12110 [Halorientalis pallida]|uniref:hypothetical protein n=1 Tax=Halorientalis pallida TaxID=2479928 RepID=UPI003C6F646F
MYDKSILAKSTGASLGVVAIVGMLFLSTGTAFAAPVAGIGGFTIEANSITGDNLILYPGTSQAENTTDISGSQSPQFQDQYPVGIVELTNTEIDGLELTKVFDLQNFTKPKNVNQPLLPGKARIKIISDSSQNVTTNSIIIKTPQIAADKAKFSGLEVKENTVDNPTEVTSWLELRTQEEAESPIPEGQGLQFDSRYNYSGGSSPGLVLQDPFIRATYLATDSITIPNLRLEVQYNPDNDDVYEWAS